ncbi:MAG: hypothetical protein WA210_13990 [Burkholderiaceae bacterium]
MNDLEQFFNQHTGRLIHKWRHYFEIYDRHFARFRGRPVNIVEFGVSQGGSMLIWKHYFGPDVKVFGVDINPNCKQFEEPGVQIFIKGFIDALHAWHSREPQRLAITDFTRSVHSVHYYDSVVVVEKRPMVPPTHERVGEAAFPDYQPPKAGVLASIKRRIRGRQGG